jgi:hypothetical protein
MAGAILVAMAHEKWRTQATISSTSTSGSSSHNRATLAPIVVFPVERLGLNCATSSSRLVLSATWWI